MFGAFFFSRPFLDYLYILERSKQRSKRKEKRREKTLGGKISLERGVWGEGKEKKGTPFF